MNVHYVKDDLKSGPYDKTSTRASAVNKFVKVIFILKCHSTRSK